MPMNARPIWWLCGRRVDSFVHLFVWTDLVNDMIPHERQC